MQEKKGTLSVAVASVLDKETNGLLDSQSLAKVNEEFLNKNSSSLSHAFAGTYVDAVTDIDVRLDVN